MFKLFLATVPKLSTLVARSAWARPQCRFYAPSPKPKTTTTNNARRVVTAKRPAATRSVAAKKVPLKKTVRGAKKNAPKRPAAAKRVGVAAGKKAVRTAKKKTPVAAKKATKVEPKKLSFLISDKKVVVPKGIQKIRSGQQLFKLQYQPKLKSLSRQDQLKVLKNAWARIPEEKRKMFVERSKKQPISGFRQFVKTYKPPAGAKRTFVSTIAAWKALSTEQRLAYGIKGRTI